MVDIDIKNAIENYTLFILLLFVVSLIFDISVTYTIFKYEKNLFIESEFNKELVMFLINGDFPIINFLFIFIPMTTTLVSYYYFDKTEQKEALWVLFFCLFVTMLVASYHFFGGLTWLV